MGTLTAPNEASGSCPAWIARVSNRSSSVTGRSSHLGRKLPAAPSELPHRILAEAGIVPQHGLPLCVVPRCEFRGREPLACRISTGAGIQAGKVRLLLLA